MPQELVTALWYGKDGAMVVWIIAIVIVYGAILGFAGMRGFGWLLNTAYDHGVEKGKKCELDRVLNLITRAVWTFRREQAGMFVFCNFVSDVGVIPIPGTVDFEDGEQVHIQRRLPHHPQCPFFFLGFEKYLSVNVYRPLEEAHDDDS